MGASAASAKEGEDAPKQTPEQNLAIRQLGAEAAQKAAAKKENLPKIGSTNPLLAEKVLSPREVPLPGLDHQIRRFVIAASYLGERS